MKMLAELREIAKELEERGYTVNLLYKKNLVLRVGKEAKAGLLSFFGPIEIKDLKTLVKLIK